MESDSTSVDPITEGSAMQDLIVRALPVRVRAATLLLSLLCLLATGPLHAVLSLGGEVNPDPAEPGELVDVQVAVSSTAATGALTLRVPWPAGLESGPFTSGGGCTGACSVGEFLVWNLGTLGAGETIVASVNPNVLGDVVNGTVIPLEFELLESNVLQTTLSLEVEVQTVSPLELAVDPLTDPVPPGGELTYELVYGNAGATQATGVTLEVPLPADTTFASASDGGIHAAGTVTWNLGTLSANTGGRVRVVVDVDNVAEATLLQLGDATLQGTISAVTYTARADALSRAATESLQAGMEVSPDPVDPGELMDAQVVIGNTSMSTTGALTLRILRQPEMESAPFTSGGVCSGACDEGEYVIFNLGTLGPGASIVASVNPNVLGSVANGQLVPFEAEVLEAGKAARTLSHTAITQLDSPLELSADPLTDPVAPGATLEYEIVFGNAGAAVANGAALTAPLPPGTTFVSATGGGSHNNGVVSWDLGTLPANAGGFRRFTVQTGAVPEASVITLDAAVLTATVSGVPRHARGLAASRIATGALQVALEVYPDPVEPGELMDAQMVIVNPSMSTTGTLTLRVLRQPEMESAIFTSGGVCSGACDEGEYVLFNLGTLAPGASVVASINPNVLGTVANGQLVPLEAELLEAGRAARTVSHTSVTQLLSPLEVAVDPLADPVPPGEPLTYEIVFGNTSADTATGSLLAARVPPGSTFVSATGGGVHANGVVTWDLGTLDANAGGHRRFTVQPGVVAGTAVIEMNAAELTGTVSGQAKHARALAASRIAGEALQAAFEAFPDPVAPGELMDAQVVITNPTMSTTGALTLRILRQPELESAPFTSGGVCSGACDEGEYVLFNLGTLGPGASLVASINPNVLGAVANGQLVPLEAEILQAGRAARSVSRTAVTQLLSPLELAVDPRTDPVAQDGTLTYDISYGNGGNAVSANTVLTFALPAGAQFVAASGGGTHNAGTVTWPLGTVGAFAAGRRTVTVDTNGLASPGVLQVHAAEIRGAVSAVSKWSRAMAASRIGPQPLQLTVTPVTNPNPANAALQLNTTISNPGVAPTGALLLRVLWPDELHSSPGATGGGFCSGACDPGEYILWNIGVLGAGSNTQVTVNAFILNTVLHGRLVPIEFELIEAGLAARANNQTVLVGTFVDTDMDGMPDATDEDDDNDGMPDWWEQLYGFNPLNAGDAGGDPDGDGKTNLQEYLDGTNPRVNEDIIFEDSFEDLD